MSALEKEQNRRSTPHHANSESIQRPERSNRSRPWNKSYMRISAYLGVNEAMKSRSKHLSFFFALFHNTNTHALFIRISLNVSFYVRIGILPTFPQPLFCVFYCSHRRFRMLSHCFYGLLFAFFTFSYTFYTITRYFLITNFIVSWEDCCMENTTFIVFAVRFKKFSIIICRAFQEVFFLSFCNHLLIHFQHSHCF